MAEGKKSFKLYTDQRFFFDDLPDEVAGKLIKHVFAYVNDEDPEEDLIMQLAFAPIKRQLKFDLKNWEKVCDRNRKNGAKGGRPKNPKNPLGSSGLKNNPNKPDKDKDKDKNTYKRKNISLPTKDEVLKYLTEKEHFDVDEVAEAGLVAGAEDEFHQQDAAVPAHRALAVPENLDRPFIVPVVDDPLHEVEIRAGWNGTEEAALAKTETIRTCPADAVLLKDGPGVGEVKDGSVQLRMNLKDVDEHLPVRASDVGDGFRFFEEV